MSIYEDHDAETAGSASLVVPDWSCPDGKVGEGSGRGSLLSSPQLDSLRGKARSFSSGKMDPREKYRQQSDPNDPTHENMPVLSQRVSRIWRIGGRTPCLSTLHGCRAVSVSGHAGRREPSVTGRCLLEHRRSPRLGFFLFPLTPARSVISDLSGLRVIPGEGSWAGRGAGRAGQRAAPHWP